MIDSSADAGERARLELARFLRSCRARLSPDDLSLDPGTRRRTPGLRREEVARLAGVSLTWYTWLEQGRDINVSADVIDALSRALRLDESQRRHVRRLAGLPAPLIEQPSVELDEVQQIVDALEGHPAMAVNRWLDIIAVNRAQAAIFDRFRVGPEKRNLLELTFEEGFRFELSNWEEEAMLTVAGFRGEFGKHPDDPRAQALVSELSASSEAFRAYWEAGVVKRFAARSYTVRQESGEVLSLRITHLRVVDQPGVTILLSMPTDEDTVKAMRRIMQALDDPLSAPAATND